MPVPKPTGPAWNAAEAARLLPGCKGFWLLGEVGGPPCYDLSGSACNGTIQGTAAQVAGMRQSGLYGAQLGSFTTSNYVQLPGTPQVIANAFPFWMVGMAISTATTASQSNLLAATQSGGLHFCEIAFARLSQYDVAYEYRDSGGGTTTLTYGNSSMPSNDGRPHVVMGVSYTASNHWVYLDGASNSGTGGQSTTTRLTNTFDVASIGVWVRNTTPALPFAGNIICAAWGNGMVPDPAALAADWLSGRFASARPARWVPKLPAAGAAFSPWRASRAGVVIGSGVG